MQAPAVTTTGEGGIAQNLVTPPPGWFDVPCSAGAGTVVEVSGACRFVVCRRAWDGWLAGQFVEVSFEDFEAALRAEYVRVQHRVEAESVQQ